MFVSSAISERGFGKNTVWSLIGKEKWKTNEETKTGPGLTSVL